jgi:DNA-binding transcriptional ArsR family regulator
MLQHLSPTHNPDPRLDAVFHALADGARRAMVGRLSRGHATVSALAQPLPMSLSAVVQHLAVLEASGLVKSEKVGRVRTCSLDTSVLTQAEVWINQRRTFWESSFDRLGAYLAETKPEDEA